MAMRDLPCCKGLEWGLLMLERIKQIWRSLVRSTPNHVRSSGDKNCVARPVVRSAASQPFSWRNETVLCLGTEAGLQPLGKALSEAGATVAFRSLTRLQDIYSLPLEQYTMAILPSGWDGLKFDVVDVGGILRRADQAMVLVWASESVVLSQVADEEMRRFCDVALSLPASAEDLELFLRPGRSVSATS